MVTVVVVVYGISSVYCTQASGYGVRGKCREERTGVGVLLRSNVVQLNDVTALEATLNGTLTGDLISDGLVLLYVMGVDSRFDIRSAS